MQPGWDMQMSRVGSAFLLGLAMIVSCRSGEMESERAVELIITEWRAEGGFPADIALVSKVLSRARGRTETRLAPGATSATVVYWSFRRCSAEAYPLSDSPSHRVVSTTLSCKY